MRSVKPGSNERCRNASPPAGFAIMPNLGTHVEQAFRELRITYADDEP